MSMRYQAAILTASYFPLKAPSAPTIGTATQASSTSVSVTFTAPTDIGGGAISSYTVVSSPGNIIGTGASSPVTVAGLTTGTAYSFQVFANNAYGNSPASASSNVVTPLAIGQQAFTTVGTTPWVCPTGVTSICVVAVGGGGGGGYACGGGGGEVRYKNNISVTPGNSYQVVVGSGGAQNYDGTGSNGTSSTFSSTIVVANGGIKGNGTFPKTGGAGGSGGTGDGGGNGGVGGSTGGGAYYGGGGGAGGYAGTGGAGASGDGQGSGSDGSGGGGGGAGAWYGGYSGGGGVGILGQGTNGTGGVGGNPGAGTNGGGGGSGGGTGSPAKVGGGGVYGGGGGGGYSDGAGGGGAVRIIWGSGRAFPSTNTGDL